MNRLIRILALALLLLLFACSDSDDPSNVNEPDSNTPPSIDLPDMINLIVNESLHRDFSEFIYDAEGDDLILSAENNHHIYIDITGLEVDFSVEQDWTGEETVIFTVIDSLNVHSASDTVLVRVNDFLGTVITIEDVSAATGSEFLVPITTTYLKEEWSVIAFQCTLSFDANHLSYEGISQEGSLVDSSILANEASTGTIIAAYAHYLPASGEGLLFNINFSARTAGESIIYLESFTYNSEEMTNLQNGTITTQ